MSLKDAKPNSGFDALEVWVDPETDLPMEFGFERKNGVETDVYRITDCRWNIEIDPKLFDTTPLEGYEDITPPSDDAASAEIVAARKALRGAERRALSASDDVQRRCHP